MERARQPDVAVAFDDEALYRIRGSAEHLQELLHRIESEVQDDRTNPRESGLPPSEDDWLSLEGTVVVEFNLACTAVAEALYLLGDKGYVRRIVPESVQQLMDHPKS